MRSRILHAHLCKGLGCDSNFVVSPWLRNFCSYSGCHCRGIPNPELVMAQRNKSHMAECVQLCILIWEGIKICFGVFFEVECWTSEVYMSMWQEGFKIYVIICFECIILWISIFCIWEVNWSVEFYNLELENQIFKMLS